MGDYHVECVLVGSCVCVFKFSVIHASCSEQHPLVGSSQLGGRFQRFVADSAYIRLQRQLLTLIFTVFFLLLFLF